MSHLQTFWGSFSNWAMGWGGLAGLVGVCLLALWFFTPFFLSSQEARALLLNFGLGCVAFAFLSGFYLTAGYRNCVSDIAKLDAAAVDRVSKSIQEIALCRISGKHWDVVNNACVLEEQK